MRLRLPAGIAVAALAACESPSVAPPPAAAPAPEPAVAPPPPPPPEAPSHRAHVWVASVPGQRGAYAVGDRIVLYSRQDRGARVEGAPRLAIEIGEAVRFAHFAPWPGDVWPPERLQFRHQFVYEVQADDQDEDGISINAEAFDFAEGHFVNAAGAEVEVSIYSVTPTETSTTGVEPGRALEAHPVGTPPPRTCTDERERAQSYSDFVSEWNGSPFRVDLIGHFPDFVTRADLEGLLVPIALLDAKIERQLGYRLVEMGEVIPLPEDTPPDWNRDIRKYHRTCPLPREEGQALFFYLDDLIPSRPNAGAVAFTRCGSFAMTQARPGNGWPGPAGDWGGPSVHELFHLFGFAHTDDYESLNNARGVPMSRTLYKSSGRRGAEAATWGDIDLLHCIFPNGS